MARRSLDARDPVMRRCRCRYSRIQPSLAIAHVATRRKCSDTLISARSPPPPSHHASNAANPSHTARLPALLPRLFSVQLTPWCFYCDNLTPSPSTSSHTSTLLPRLYGGMVMLLLPGLAVAWLGWPPPLLRLLWSGCSSALAC
jgi:hypothetical protein